MELLNLGTIVAKKRTHLSVRLLAIIPFLMVGFIFVIIAAGAIDSQSREMVIATPIALAFFLPTALYCGSVWRSILVCCENGVYLQRLFGKQILHEDEIDHAEIYLEHCEWKPKTILTLIIYPVESSRKRPLKLKRVIGFRDHDRYFGEMLESLEANMTVVGDLW